MILLDDDSDDTFHERWVLAVMLGETTPELPIYDKSIKRLQLATGLPMHDIHVCIGRLISEGNIEPINAHGYLIKGPFPEPKRKGCRNTHQ